MPVIRSRPKKLNHADTIPYEIYMLRFAADRLKREQWDDQKDAWAYLEAFLLHYRNLIEFLGKTGKIRRTDLHVTLGRPKHAIGTGPVVGVYSRNLIGDCSFYIPRSINLFESEMKRVELSETFP